MTAEKAAAKRPAGRPRRRGGGAADAAGGAAYHHGALREALLRAAIAILQREGLQGLTLRAAAREAGVSHAAPKNHFGDLTGLLSDVAAMGFEQVRAAMEAGAAELAPAARRKAIGRGYVAFALANPALFLLMFRSERLDFRRPALAEAAKAAFAVLSTEIGQRAAETDEPAVARIARIAAAWGQVHGLAMLLIDGRLRPLLAAGGVGEQQLLEAVFASPPPGR